jgi:hypothetical protein
MPKRPEDAIRAYRRKSVAERRTAGKSCKCGESRPGALVAGSTPTICARCSRKRRGESVFDAHHPAGRANHPLTIPIDVNGHRADLNDAQYDWPKKTWENRGGSPVLAGAACIRGYYDTNSYLTDQLLLWVAKLLEALDECLRERLGPKWWAGTKLEEFAPKRSSNKCSQPPHR